MRTIPSATVVRDSSSSDRSTDGWPVIRRTGHEAAQSGAFTPNFEKWLPGQDRTCDKAVNSRLLYPLSYRGMGCSGRGRRDPGFGSKIKSLKISNLSSYKYKIP